MAGAPAGVFLFGGALAAYQPWLGELRSLLTAEDLAGRPTACEISPRCHRFGTALRAYNYLFSLLTFSSQSEKAAKTVEIFYVSRIVILTDNFTKMVHRETVPEPNHMELQNS